VRPEKTTAVLLPPIGHSPDTWQFLDKALPDMACHAFPGFGRPRASHQPTMQTLADEVVQKYPGPLDLIGVSMGGMVALNIGVRWPDRVRSLLIACTGARASPHIMQTRARDAENNYAAAVSTTIERWFTESALLQPAHPGVAVARQALADTDGSSLADGWRAIATHDTVDRLQQITVPVTAVAGGLDLASPVARSRQIVDLVAMGELVLVKHAPHMIHLECPGDFSAVIANHLAKAAQARGNFGH
jgi:3-oxoadipate enol-lactonase